MHHHNLSDLNILDLWSPLNICKFQGNHGQWIVINLSQFQLFQQFQLLATHPSPLSHMASICVHVPGASVYMFHRACQCQGGQKGPCSPNTEDLITDFCFWLQRYKEAGGHCWLHLLPLLQVFSLWLKSIPGDLKGQCLFPVFHFPIFFFFFESHMLKTRTFKKTGWMGKISKWLGMHRERLRKYLRRLKFIPQACPLHGRSL